MEARQRAGLGPGGYWEKLGVVGPFFCFVDYLRASAWQNRLQYTRRFER
ncbi:hypothetical protein NSND_60201 [Nitrospira sp. ND1]|nr:hypothetical protein NSND_60201 [Nitrospira sp. ND1]